MRRTSQNKKQSQDSYEPNNSLNLIYCYTSIYYTCTYSTKNIAEIRVSLYAYLKNQSLIILLIAGSLMGEKSKSGRFVAKYELPPDVAPAKNGLAVYNKTSPPTAEPA